MWSSGCKESLFHFHSIIWKRNLDPNPDEAPKRFVLHIQCCICREHGQCEQWIILHQLFFQNCYSPTAFSIPHCYLRCKLWKIQDPHPVWHLEKGSTAMAVIMEKCTSAERERKYKSLLSVSLYFVCLVLVGDVASP